MRAIASLVLMLSIGSASAAVSYRVEGHRISFTLDDGLAVLDCISTTSFRFVRNWNERPIGPAPNQSDDVTVSVEDHPEALVVNIRYLMMEISKADLRMRVRVPGGPVLLNEIAAPQRAGRTIRLDRSLASTERFFGLGGRSDASVNLRGRQIQATKPLLISTAGYGEYFKGAGSYTFDLGAADPDRCRTELGDAETLEYFFYYGPAPKEILEQYMLSMGQPADSLPVGVLGILNLASLPKPATPLGGGAFTSWQDFRGELHRWNHLSLSATLYPAFDRSRYRAIDDAELRQRIIDLSTILPIVYDSGGLCPRPNCKRRRTLPSGNGNAGYPIC